MAAVLQWPQEHAWWQCPVATVCATILAGRNLWPKACTIAESINSWACRGSPRCARLDASIEALLDSAPHDGPVRGIGRHHYGEGARRNVENDGSDSAPAS